MFLFYYFIDTFTYAHNTRELTNRLQKYNILRFWSHFKLLNLQAIGVFGQRLSKSVERKTLPCTILCRHYQRLEEKVSTREGGEKDVAKVVRRRPQ